jgi:uncharacterized protein (TIGR02996 family)
MTESDFLAAIFEQPGDDLARLAYADWLMERPDQDRAARGEFIQVQIQLTRLTEGPANPVDWIDSARIPELKAMQPLAESPLLAQLHYLDLGYNALGLPGMQALRASPHWGKVRTLILTGNYPIDAGAQQRLVPSLQGTPDPALLRALLQMTVHGERTYSNRHIRELAIRAGGHPRPVEVLSEALSGGRRIVRAAAARMVAQLGAGGAPALPKLVQRLFEQDITMRDQVAPSLAQLVYELPAVLQNWMCLIANPLLPAEANLRAVIESPRLPAEVREGLAGLCARRAAWWKHIACKRPGPAPAPDGFRTGLAAVRKMVAELMDRAKRQAGRHLEGEARKSAGEAARVREAAWLLARVTALLQKVLAG